MKVGIVGASGYTGAELIRILCNHPHAEITVATSRQYDGQSLNTVFPHLRNKTDLLCENLAPSEIIDRTDLVFTAVPHKTAMEIVPIFLKAGKKVVDLSADFRITNKATYEKWYQTHTAPELLKDAVYGLPELYRDQIRNCTLVANPGCYPTSIILALAPLLKNKCIDPETIIADSKSGTSGAGRAASVGSLFCEVADGFRPYKVADHRHTPEIEQELSLITERDVHISFTPHLLPISRGILSTIYATLSPDVTSDDISKAYEQFFSKDIFVRFLGEGGIPATQFVRGSNFCDIGFKIDQRTNRIIVMSAIDNVVKGASGQAVQNMNLLYGFDEDQGLTGAPFFP